MKENEKFHFLFLPLGDGASCAGRYLGVTAGKEGGHVVMSAVQMRPKATQTAARQHIN
jgi:hypothetical protein